MTTQKKTTLKIGFIGSGFIADFHLKSLISVRNVEVIGVYSTTPKKRNAFAKKVSALKLGDCIAHNSLEELIAVPGLDAVWVLSPNYTRKDVIDTITKMVNEKRSSITAIASEKPLARNLKEAKHILAAVEGADLLHGYLENQVFSPSVTQGKEIIWNRAVPSAGRPYLARATEEHCGPHEAWFWDGETQGGGVLSDMMCHSVEVGRFMLTDPKKTRDSLKLISATASVANLKWTRENYSRQLQESMGLKFDYKKTPVEDFARGVLRYEDSEGNQLLVEASTSWSYVGPGLKIALEMQGPEYAMEFDSLKSNLNVFMSRQIQGEQGEDLVEKQNAEQGLMPIAQEEPNLYGYVAENRHMVECFIEGKQPSESFVDGVAVVEILMGLYKSAQENRTVFFADEDLTNFVPEVAKQTKVSL